MPEVLQYNCQFVQGKTLMLQLFCAERVTPGKIEITFVMVSNFRSK